MDLSSSLGVTLQSLSVWIDNNNKNNQKSQTKKQSRWSLISRVKLTLPLTAMLGYGWAKKEKALPSPALHCAFPGKDIAPPKNQALISFVAAQKTAC